MGERGHTFHVLDGSLGSEVAGAGQRVAILATNERWTTFVPTNASTFDAEAASRVLDRTLVHVCFDDDAGLTLLVYRSGDLVGELSLPTEDAELSDSDVELTATLEELGVLSGGDGARLMKRMSDAAGVREWTMAHGVEKLLELPYFSPVPLVPERALLPLLPATATIVEGRRENAARGATRKPRASKSAGVTKMPPPKTTWSDDERATVDLHCEYWTTVFSLNNFALANRYKKHLPAEHRRMVDRLCEAVTFGDSELPELVQGILARIWSCADWDAVIRDPALIDGDEAVWNAWLARVSS